MWVWTLSVTVLNVAKICFQAISAKSSVARSAAWHVGRARTASTCRAAAPPTARTATRRGRRRRRCASRAPPRWCRCRRSPTTSEDTHRESGSLATRRAARWPSSWPRAAARSGLCTAPFRSSRSSLPSSSRAMGTSNTAKTKSATPTIDCAAPNVFSRVYFFRPNVSSLMWKSDVETCAESWF